MLSAQNLKVLITGASAGIGAASAALFAEAGARLVLAARRSDRLEDMGKALGERGAGDVFLQETDVRSQEDVDRLVRTTLDHWGQPPDILLNNAGLVLGLDPVAEGRPEDWQTIFDTNVMGVLRVTRGFLPAMLTRKTGHIIMTGSIAGHQAYEGGSAYCGSKHALKAITAALKLELNGTGIRLTSIDPGMVETEFSLVRFRGDETRARQVYAGLTPLTAVDVAECIYFAATRNSSVNIDEMIVMPTDQASVHKVHRRP